MGARGPTVAIGFSAALLLLAPLLSFAQSNDDVEARVRAYFADVPVMANIAKCESEFRQFGASGALHGGMGGSMIGVFQIHEDVHADYAKERGMDIYSLDGNLAYAQHLYEKEGTTPWDSSASCWEGMALASATPRIVTANPNPLGDAPMIVNQIIPPFTSNLSMGMENAEVQTLQRFLNGAGFTIIESGPGSPGNETTRFGALTRAAVMKFQCAKGIVCDGDERSTGYGYFGARTRAALLATPQDLSLIPPINFAATSSPPYRPVQHDGGMRLQTQTVELSKV